MEDDKMTTAGGAVDIVNPCWRLDEPNYYRDTSTDNCEYVKLYQQAGFQPTNTPVAQQDWHFRMSDLNSWYHMSQSFFEFQFQVADKQTLDGAVSTLESRCLTYPSDMRTLFKNVQLDLNSVSIESNNNNAFMFYNVDRAFMSRQYLETAGSLGGMFLTDMRIDHPALLGADASFQTASTTFTSGATGPLITQPFNGNTARLQTYAKKQVLATIPRGETRAAKTGALSTVCTLRVAMPDIFNFYRYWTRCHKGIDVQCRFTTVGDGAFITDRTRDGVGAPAPRAANTYGMRWAGSGITWWVKSLKPSPRVEAGLNAMLQKGAEIFCPFEHPRVYNFNPLGAGDQSFRIVNESSRITKMFVCWQRKTVQTTSDDISVVQAPAGITKYTAFVNGKKVPAIDISITSTEPPPHGGAKYATVSTTEFESIPSQFDYTELYHRYLLMTGTYNSAFKNNYAKGSGALGYVDWSCVSPFVSFDLSANAIGDISGSNSEVVLNYSHAEVPTSTANPITPITDYTLYAIVYTERTVSLNLSEASTYVAIR